MAKSADAFRTISEVADWLETPAHVLRFWESKFSQVKPVKRAGGRRYYRPADMKLLGGIKKLLHDDGMTIKGVQKMLREQGVAFVSDFSQPLGDAADDVVIERSEEAAAPAPSAPDRSPAPAPVMDRPATPPAAATADAAPEPKPEPKPEPEPEAGKEAAAPPLTFSRHATGKTAQPETTEAPAEEAPPTMPSFLERRGTDAAQTPSAVEENVAEEAPAPASASPEPVKPRPRIVDVPADPDDGIAADPGVLSLLARIRKPVSADTAKTLEALADKLRATTGAAAKD